MIARLSSTLINRLWLIFAASIIFFAVIVSLSRAFLPFIHWFKQDLEDLLSEKVQVETKIEHLEAKWVANGPQVSISNIKMIKDGRSLLDVERVEVSINFWESLINLRIETDQVSIANANFVVDISEFINPAHATNINLSNTKPTSNTSTSNTLQNIDLGYSLEDFVLDTFLGQSAFLLNNANFQIEQSGRQKRNIKLDLLEISNFDIVHQLEFRIEQSSSSYLYGTADIFGDPRLAGSAFDLYLKGEQIQLTQLPFVREMAQIETMQTSFTGEIWASYDDDGWKDAIVELNLTPFELARDDESVRFDSLSFKSQGSRKVDSKGMSGFTGKITELTLKNKRKQLDLSGFVVNLSSSNATKKWDTAFLTYSNEHVSDIFPLINLWLPKGDAKSWLESSNISFGLETLNVQLNKKDRWLLNQASAQLRNISMLAVDSTPGINNLNASFLISPSRGQFRLNSHQATIDYRELFRWPIEVGEINLSGEWSLLDDLSLIVFDNVFVQSKDFKLAASSNLFFPKDLPANISVYAEVANANAEKKSLFLPVSVMDEGLINYLDESVEGGNLKWARFNFQGALVEDMLEKKETTFEILAEAESLEYRFLPDYPKLDTLNATLFFDQHGMNINAFNSHFQNIKVKTASAIIKDFSADVPILELDLKVESDHKSAQNYINDSALKDVLSEVLAQIKPEKNFPLSLKINAPLAGNETIDVHGQVSLNKHKVSFPELNFVANELTGTVLFSESEIWSTPLDVNLFGGKSTVELATTDYDGSSRLTLKSLGKVKPYEVLDWIIPKNQLAVKGSSNYQLNGWICISNCLAGNIHLDIDTDLIGTTIELPEPLTKLKEQSEQVNVRVDISSTHQNIDFSMNQKLIGSLDFVKQNDQFRLSQGSVTLGQFEQVVSVAQGAININTYLEKAELFEWISHISGLIAALTKSSSSEQDATSISPLIKVGVGALQLGPVTLNEVKADITVEDGITQVVFNSLETKGSLNFSTPQEISIVLEHLELTEKHFMGEPESEESSKREDFLSWPLLKVKCNSCKIFNAKLGSIELQTKIENNIWVVDGILDRKGFIKAPFHVVYDQEADMSRFVSDFSANDIGGTLRGWDLTVGIQESKATGIIDVYWNENPFLFNFKTLNGVVTLNLAKGYLEEVSDSKARIFSLFSVQSLLRRLSLDFSDLYKNGFFYDNMKGELQLKDGLVSTNNFSINGNAADVSLSGFVDLNNRLIDQRALVTPKITSSLPVLAGWAVTPATGVLVWLFSKVFEPAIDVISNIEYRIVGDWENTQVIEVSKSIKEIELTEEQLEAIKKVQQEQEEQEKILEEPKEQ